MAELTLQTALPPPLPSSSVAWSSATRFVVARLESRRAWRPKSRTQPRPPVLLSPGSTVGGQSFASRPSECYFALSLTSDSFCTPGMHGRLEMMPRATVHPIQAFCLCMARCIVGWSQCKRDAGVCRPSLGMAPAGAGAGLAKTRPQSNPRDWEKPAREQTRGCIFAPAPAPADFGRVLGARGSNNKYNKNVQIHQFKQSNNTFLQVIKAN